MEKAIAQYNKGFYIWGNLAYHTFKVEKLRCELEFERACSAYNNQIRNEKQ